MERYKIMLIHIDHRSQSALKVQDVLSKFGCNIKVRIGLHETTGVCAEDGMVILQMAGEDEAIMNLQKELNKLNGVNAKLVQMP